MTNLTRLKTVPLRPYAAMTDPTMTLALFFLALPFAYVLQVVTLSPYGATVPYILLSLCLFQISRQHLHQLIPSLAEPFSVGFILLMLHNMLMWITISGEVNAGLVIRVLVLFTLPILLFWVPRAIGISKIESIFKMLCVGALIVALELLYESISTQVLGETSAFQMLNKSYLNTVLGKDLTQLYLPRYRATGLLEHAHATAFFLNVGLFVAAVLYIYRNGIPYLMVALVCAIAVWTQGFRLPILAQIVVLFLLSSLIWLDKEPSVRHRVIIFAVSLAALIMLVMVIDPTHVVQKYYFPSLKGDFQLAEDTDVGKWLHLTAEDLITESYWWKWIHGEWGMWREAMFGHGLVGTLSGRYPFSDDLFLLAVPMQYGIGGGVIFAAIWLGAVSMGFLIFLRHHESMPTSHKIAGFIALATILLLALSMAHSGILQRKAIFPLFPFFAGILTRLYMNYSKEPNWAMPILASARTTVSTYTQ